VSTSEGIYTVAQKVCDVVKRDEQREVRSKVVDRNTTSSKLTLSSVEELIQVLETRAETILRQMEHEKCAGGESIRKGRGRLGRKSRGRLGTFFFGQLGDGAVGFSKEMDAIRALFMDLHEKNKITLRDGQMILSHEITIQIHHLLWVRARNIFWEAYSEAVAYRVDFGSASSYFNDYPGELDYETIKSLPEALQQWLRPPKELDYKWKTTRRIIRSIERRLKQDKRSA
jgi:hypothetical protein